MQLTHTHTHTYVSADAAEEGGLDEEAEFTYAVIRQMPSPHCPRLHLGRHIFRSTRPLKHFYATAF